MPHIFSFFSSNINYTPFIDSSVTFSFTFLSTEQKRYIIRLPNETSGDAKLYEMAISFSYYFICASYECVTFVLLILFSLEFCLNHKYSVLLFLLPLDVNRRHLRSFVLLFFCGYYCVIGRSNDSISLITEQ